MQTDLRSHGKTQLLPIGSAKAKKPFHEEEDRGFASIFPSSPHRDPTHGRQRLCSIHDTMRSGSPFMQTAAAT